jgi:delta8-fatty-acid desaturase
MSDQIHATHPKWAMKMMSRYAVGALDKPNPVDEATREYRALRKLVRSPHSGLLSRDENLSFYTRELARALLILGLAAYFTVTSSTFLMRMVGAALVGFFFQQIAFMGHDAGHNSVFQRLEANELFGVLVGNTLGGISIAWWKTTHNVHHVVTNSVSMDPDVQHMPLVCVSDKYFEPVASTYHEGRVTQFDALSRALVSQQHRLFPVVMALARFNLYAQSLFMALFGSGVRNRGREILGLALFYTWFGWLASHNPTLLESVCWVITTSVVASLLHYQICVSHFSMETFSMSPQDEASFFETQLASTMDLNCPPGLDWLHGGLQFQIEHHLFPRVPRPKLRRLQKLVLERCRRVGIHHHKIPFGAAVAEMFAHLRNIAQRKEVVLSPLFDDGWNARG